MNLSRYEKETNINFNDEEKTATVYTCNSNKINTYIKYCKEFPEHYKLICQDKISATFEINKKLISIRKPRVYTQEELNRLKRNFDKNKKLD